MSTAERRFVWAWTALLWLVMFLPVWHGYREAPPGWAFTGFVGTGGSEHHAQLAWIRQAVEGEWLFRNLYTPEPQQGGVWLPLSWLIGLGVRVSGAPPMALWYAVQALGCAVLVGGIYRFASRFSADLPTRNLATVLATTASGLGWLWPGSAPGQAQPIDLWMPEANALRALTGSYLTLPLALGLLLRSLARAHAYLEGGRLRDARIAGALALGLAALHPFGLVPLYALWIAWLPTRPGRLVGGLWMAGLSAPLALYWALGPGQDPLLSRVWWSPRPPGPAAHALGFGLPLALAALAPFVPRVWRENRGVGLLLMWPALVAVWLALPEAWSGDPGRRGGLARGLVWGVHVPLCVLAAMTARAAFRSLLGSLGDRTLRGEIGTALAVGLAGLCAVGSGAAYLELFRQNALHWPGRHLPPDYGEALEWLDAHGEPGQVVLAAPVLARRLPGRTGLAVYVGHWALSVEHGARQRFVRDFFQEEGGPEPAEWARVLERHRVRFVAVDRASAERYELAPPGSEYLFLPRVEPAFRNEEVEIFRVR